MSQSPHALERLFCRALEVSVTPPTPRAYGDIIRTLSRLPVGAACSCAPTKRSRRAAGSLPLLLASSALLMPNHKPEHLFLIPSSAPTLEGDLTCYF